MKNITIIAGFSAILTLSLVISQYYEPKTKIITPQNAQEQVKKKLVSVRSQPKKVDYQPLNLEKTLNYGVQQKYAAEQMQNTMSEYQLNLGNREVSPSHWTSGGEN